MRKLDRQSVAAPPCLTQYQQGRNSWGDVSREHKTEIRTHLEMMQGRRCAYCECCLDLFGHHIEHFRRKYIHPKLTFAWCNLFWSCDCTDRCGHYKDHGAGPYDPGDLLDPTVDDPEDYFRFYSDGTIRILAGLNERERHRATETLRVFNLCSEMGPLRDIRMTYCLGYKAMGEEIAELATDADEALWEAFLQDELDRIRGLPFETAIKHTLQPWTNRTAQSND